MRVFGIILLLSGIFFLMYTFLSDPDITSTTIRWTPWIGVLVLLTGGVSYYIARDEE